ncbi:hypothetical protein [Paraflavitalea speifideaquila]|uniref:hypothetical protein n=1 Tax=Paraflavitalea speifideaquila TaxID=3076558 RepID=UPI0028E91FCA|nr:hypothetical protein [Paraflavitalea speifideiaquila]
MFHQLQHLFLITTLQVQEIVTRRQVADRNGYYLAACLAALVFKGTNAGLM